MDLFQFSGDINFRNPASSSQSVPKRTPKSRPNKRSAPPSASAMKLSQDPQSVAARERRHRISDRFKILKSMVPGGSQMDTVSMLEEAIHYVKFLKAQIWLHQNFNYAVDEYENGYRWSRQDISEDYQTAFPPSQPSHAQPLSSPHLPPLPPGGSHSSSSVEVEECKPSAHYYPNYYRDL